MKWSDLLIDTPGAWKAMLGQHIFGIALGMLTGMITMREYGYDAAYWMFFFTGFTGLALRSWGVRQVMQNMEGEEVEAEEHDL